MGSKSINKKVVALLFVLIGEIIISMSEQSMSVNLNSDATEIAVSKRLTNEVSSYPQVADAEKKIKDFLDKWNVEGASVAIAKDERLIYAKGFGYADRENKVNVQPEHLFRVASISKLITAVTIMKLKEEERLKLNDLVFGKKGILDDPRFQDIKDPRVKDITVYHLLTHSGGWDRYSGDPVFMPYTIRRVMDAELPVDLETTIEYTMSKRSLDFTPGLRSSYSNFGYAVLGKVIENITGKDYETYVTTHILNPLGIYDMHLGYSQSDKLFPNEVHYYSNSRYNITYSSYKYHVRVPSYYGGNNLQVLGAAGAWVASPAELLKLLVHIDGYSEKKDILSEETLNQMIQSKPAHNPIGWLSVSYNGIWKRSGTLAGTSALMKRCSNGFSWVMLVNTSNDQGHDFTYEIDRAMSDFLDQVDYWPRYDLFQYNSPKPLYTFTNSYSD